MFGGRRSDLGEQFHDVGLGIASVSDPSDCLHVDVEPPGAVLVRRKREGPQHAERPLDRGTYSPACAESTQRAVTEACHQQREVVILIALKDSGADPAMLAGHDVRLRLAASKRLFRSFQTLRQTDERHRRPPRARVLQQVAGYREPSDDDLSPTISPTQQF